MRIDTHQHIVPPRYAEWMHDKGIRPGGVDLPSWSPSAALKFMDGHGIQTGILSLSTPGVYFADAAEALRWAREVNEYTAAVVAKHPERFGFFATLTLPDVEGALAEASYALDTLHADGIVLLANNDGRYLGAPEFEPLLEFLHRRAVTVFIHPGELPAPEVPGIPTFTADFLLDTTRTAISLILSGAMKKYPGIKFILAHAGGFVPYVAYRILLTMLNEKNKAQQAWALVDQKHQIPKHLAVLKQFYYDVALSSTPAALPSLLEVADPAHITYGSDFPFAPPVAIGFLNKQYENYPLTPALRDAIDRGNAEALFPRLKI
ncbi:amidohydrolase [Kibdelosporangium aridum]|uniref:Amidohydrolase n=1 Tax=Kibdelosporangium aridum TaxID=2030 RepID=A0A428YYM7_KIBAR|nr:amidohydrolase family protein [Kibdelosporangium aridum]RSM75932.1 amidohydrolase [Kibdelosporangium aridum]